jgi:PAS domain S-box-containing protein
MELNIIMLILLISSILSFILAVFVWRRRYYIGTPSLGGLLIAVSLWTFASALEIAAPTFELKKIFNSICYFSIIQVPVWFFLFAIEYTGTFRITYRRLRLYVWFIPFISFLMLISNGYHSLFFSSTTYIETEQYSSLIVEYGLWWWVHTSYSYFLILSSIIMFIQMLMGSLKQQRDQIWIILLSSLIPIFFNITHIVGIKPFPYTDLTPVAFTISGILFFWGIYSKNLFSVMPLALDTLFSNLPDGIIVLDNNNSIVDLNESAKAMLSVDEKYANGKISIETIFPPFQTIFDKNQKLPIEIEFNGKVIEFSHSSMFNHYGQNVGVLLIFRDIGDKKSTETELKATRDRFELAIIAAGLDPWENNLLTGTMVGGEKIFHDLGYDQDDIPLNLDELFKLIHPDDIKTVKQNINNHIVGRTNLYTTDFRLKDKEGNFHWFANYGRIVERDEKGNPIRFIGLTLNINDRKKIEEKIRKQNEDLQKANAEKDKFFSIIAHDLKGPFQGFIGLTEIMTQRIIEMSREDIQEISKTLLFTAKNLYELLENLLNWALVKRGNKLFNVEKIRLKAAAESVIEMVKHQASQKDHKISNDIDSNIDVLADREAIKTIFRNLISNAIKFTPKGGFIKLSSESTTYGFIMVSIKDTGIGMSNELINNLFKINQKVSRLGTDQESSTGLGLILCKEFIEKHGGKIWVKSDPDKGSTFSFTLPCAD